MRLWITMTKTMTEKVVVTFLLRMMMVLMMIGNWLSPEEHDSVDAMSVCMQIVL